MIRTSTSISTSPCSSSWFSSSSSASSSVCKSTSIRQSTNTSTTSSTKSVSTISSSSSSSTKPTTSTMSTSTSTSTSTTTSTDAKSASSRAALSVSISNSTFPTPVDTLFRSKGVYSAFEVANASLPSFCSITDQHINFCKQLQDIVSVCIDDPKNNCTGTTARSLLAWVVDNELYATAVTNTVVEKVCYGWWHKTNWCKSTRKDACGIHHVFYLLKGLRDFLALPKGQVK
ncbi:hypothetical protein K504DRAFT_230337 [Pleomassaria siparia CBS 279.74]|uniref:Uncharacterized protein n=1 Tax=Pleomassaria siparia CBS 279.74 TaxID=1314801 RepID=A0A6G1KG67_9PLEO|nr:hypothetical protein K504DRAFT_230337 [Pleomassaria siparia CBS 279.74]